MSQQPHDPPFTREIPHPGPRPGTNFAAFPELLLPAGARLYRVHETQYGCWHFSPRAGDEPAGRFDLPGRADGGTCYTSHGRFTSLGERLGPDLLTNPNLVSTAFNTWSVSSITTTAPYRLADLTRRTCAPFGAAGRELSVALPYSTPQGWALRWAAAGFRGVHYYPRHDAQPSARSIALFGPAGAPAPDDPLWPDPGTAQPATSLLRSFARAYGLEIIVPSLTTVHLVDNPY